MKIDIAKTLTKSPKERVLVIINHQAEISMGYGGGFLSDQDITSLVASFKTDRELEVYNKYREIFKKAQHFLININQINLIYKEEVQKIDKLLIIKKSYEDIKDFKDILESALDENFKNKALKLIDNSTLQCLFKKVDCNGKFDFEGQINKMLSCYQDILSQRQIYLKSAIQAFKDALRENSFKVKAFEKKISSIEQRYDKKNTLLGDYLLIEKRNLDSASINLKQYQSFRETYL